MAILYNNKKRHDTFSRQQHWNIFLKAISHTIFTLLFIVLPVGVAGVRLIDSTLLDHGFTHICKIKSIMLYDKRWEKSAEVSCRASDYVLWACVDTSYMIRPCSLTKCVCPWIKTEITSALNAEWSSVYVLICFRKISSNPASLDRRSWCSWDCCVYLQTFFLSAAMKRPKCVMSRHCLCEHDISRCCVLRINISHLGLASYRFELHPVISVDSAVDRTAQTRIELNPVFYASLNSLR